MNQPLPVIVTAPCPEVTANVASGFTLQPPNPQVLCVCGQITSLSEPEVSVKWSADA